MLSEPQSSNEQEHEDESEQENEDKSAEDEEDSDEEEDDSDAPEEPKVELPDRATRGNRMGQVHCLSTIQQYTCLLGELALIPAAKTWCCCSAGCIAATAQSYLA